MWPLLFKKPSFTSKTNKYYFMGIEAYKQTRICFLGREGIIRIFNQMNCTIVFGKNCYSNISWDFRFKNINSSKRASPKIFLLKWPKINNIKLFISVPQPYFCKCRTWTLKQLGCFTKGNIAKEFWKIIRSNTNILNWTSTNLEHYNHDMYTYWIVRNSYN